MQFLFMQHASTSIFCLIFKQNNYQTNPLSVSAALFLDELNGRIYREESPVPFCYFGDAFLGFIIIQKDYNVIKFITSFFLFNCKQFNFNDEISY